MLYRDTNSIAALQPSVDQVNSGPQDAVDDDLSQMIDNIGVDSYYEQSPVPRPRDTNINYIDYREDSASLSDQNYDHGHRSYYDYPSPQLIQPSYSGQIQGRDTKIFEDDPHIEKPLYNGLINGSN